MMSYSNPPIYYLTQIYMEKSQSQRPYAGSRNDPKEFESTGKSARTRRALNNMMEDFECAAPQWRKQEKTIKMHNNYHITKHLLW